jgi:Protein of unknown function (DUF2874).
MKTKLFMLLFAFAAISFVACDDDDNYLPETSVVNAFNSKYPQVKKVSWERKADYQVAEFVLDRRETEAWFDGMGNWFMTETDIRFEELPLAIQEKHVLGEYANWRVDDVDKIERYNTEVIYVVEVEKGEQDVELIYAADGTLIKVITDDIGKPHQPLVITEAINTFITEKYPGAKILEYDNERWGIEVDILHDRKYKDVLFSSNGEWLRTEWDVRKSEVPSVVLSTIEQKYRDYKIDDIEFHETPAGVRYAFELEKGKTEINVYISVDGTEVTK